MKKRMASHFFIGIVISFTIEILVMAFATALGGQGTIAVSLIGQAFALSICCALVGTICSADRLSFFMQAVFTYILALATVLLFSFVFDWGNMGEGIFNGNSFIVMLIILFTISYSITMLFTWVYQKKKKKLMNDKLAKYKENVEGK
jgi:hypothetical protein